MAFLLSRFFTATTLVRLEVVCMVVNSRCFDPKKKELAYSIYSYIYIYIFLFFGDGELGAAGQDVEP